MWHSCKMAPRSFEGYFKVKSADFLFYENLIIASLGGYRGFAIKTIEFVNLFYSFMHRRDLEWPVTL